MASFGDVFFRSSPLWHDPAVSNQNDRQTRRRERERGRDGDDEKKKEIGRKRVILKANGPWEHTKWYTAQDELQCFCSAALMGNSHILVS